MTGEIIRDDPLSWRGLAAVAEGATLSLSDASLRRVADARGRGLVESERARDLIQSPAVDFGVRERGS